MFATVVSTVIAQRIEPESIYTLKLKQRGIDVRARRDVNLMRAILVEEAMTPASELRTVKPTTPLSELARMFQETSHHGFAVLDEHGELYGIVALSDLEHTLGAGRTKATVGDISTTNVLTAFPDEMLDDALGHFGSLDVGRMPVVDRANPRRLVGMLRRGDIVHAYSHALLDKQGREHYVERLRLEAATGAELVELDLNYGDAAIGKRLKEIALPPDSVIVSVQRGGRVVVPRGNTQLLPGDRVIALTNPGNEASVRRTLTEGDQKEGAEAKP